MNVQVRDGLAHPIVDSDERTGRAEASFHCPGNSLGLRHEGLVEIRRNVEERAVMLFGTDQAVARKQRAVVEENDN
jgi:hypothetical protein